MNEKDLEKLHELLVMQSEEVKRICNDNGINYSLTGGSMIGAAVSYTHLILIRFFLQFLRL